MSTININISMFVGGAMIYRTVNDIPSEGRHLIEELLDKGVLESQNGEINLDEVIYKVLIILARLDLI